MLVHNRHKVPWFNTSKNQYLDGIGEVCSTHSKMMPFHSSSFTNCTRGVQNLVQQMVQRLCWARRQFRADFMKTKTQKTKSPGPELKRRLGVSTKALQKKFILWGTSTRFHLQKTIVVFRKQISIHRCECYTCKTKRKHKANTRFVNVDYQISLEVNVKMF